jgi:hypothetical protein
MFFVVSFDIFLSCFSDFRRVAECHMKIIVREVELERSLVGRWQLFTWVDGFLKSA